METLQRIIALEDRLKEIVDTGDQLVSHGVIGLTEIFDAFLQSLDFLPEEVKQEQRMQYTRHWRDIDLWIRNEYRRSFTKLQNLLASLRLYLEDGGIVGSDSRLGKVLVEIGDEVGRTGERWVYMIDHFFSRERQNLIDGLRALAKQYGTGFPPDLFPVSEN